MPRVSKKSTTPKTAESVAEPELAAEPEPTEACPCMDEAEAAVEETEAGATAEEAAAAPKKTKKKRTYRSSTETDAEPKPKRPPNAFMIYSKEQRTQFDTKAMKVTEIAKEIGAKWRALSEEEQGRYKQMAAELKVAA